MGTTARNFLKAAYAAYGMVVVLAAAPAYALDVAESPLFLTVAVEPNITVTLDDSGSMARAFVPDLCGALSDDCSYLNNRFTKSAHFNPLYYNPRIKYPPAKNASGADLSTSFSSAHRSGFATHLGTVNLSRAYRPTAALALASNDDSESFMNHYASDISCDNAASPRVCRIGTSTAGRSTVQCQGNNNNARDNFCREYADDAVFPAYYYVYDASNTGCDGSSTNNACYSLRMVTATSGMDQDGDGTIEASEADERQNFANWYSFARTRNLTTQTAASLSFADLNSNVRVGWQALNSCRGSTTSILDTDCDGWRNNFSNVSNAIRPFTGTHKSNFYAWLSQLPTSGTTPLRNAMKRVGDYYGTSGENSPYDNDFTTSNSGEHACRRNYHVMMTDGIWNDSASIIGGNTDNATITLPETVDGISQYSARAPYADSHSNTLADISFYYWSTDLRSNLNNNLLRSYRDSTGTAPQNFWNPRNNPATWQHMVNFTIGLGLTDYLRQEGLTWDPQIGMFGGSYSGLAAGTTAWPEPSSNDPANVADLWHAAINSRGQFFSADDPSSLSVAFRSALTAITDAAGSAAALSANSTSLTGTTLVYQARFDSDWSGALIALPVGSNGVVQAPAWDASTRIPAHDVRKIFTHNGSGGIEFDSCTALSTAQQTALNMSSGGVADGQCEARLQWLRGNPRDELRTTSGLRMFRNRPTTVMGDIVNSDPAYVKDVNYQYGSVRADYVDYRANNASRMPMVYVGSNDGHLYGIRGDNGAPDSGQVKFSYIPAGVYHNLRHLMDPSYAHRYYVDGSISVGDAYIGNAWRTILVAGLNAGGKSVYALDVTDPENFDESDVLWEFNGHASGANALSAADAADMGLSYSRPQIGLLENGDWVAIFGNGYNSTDEGAHLFVVDLETGALLRKITAVDVTTAGVDEENGLSTPVLLDADGDRRIDAAYAGDLQGNLWKFDLSGSRETWAVSNSAPLFEARIGATGQPITAQPKIASHPHGGHLIVFGTGRYLTNDDVFDTSRQTYYGIWDNGTAGTVRRNNLQVQTFDLQQAAFGRTVRSVTNNTVDWEGGVRGWYLDLLDGVGPTAPTIGERVIHTSLITAGRVIFGSIIPSTNPCTPGGRSWLIELKLFTGGAFSNSILDLNNDGQFDGEDTLDPDDPNAETINAVSNDSLGISNVPVWIDDPNSENGPAKGHKIRTGTTGNFSTETNCAYENEQLCRSGPTGPPGGSVTRRSWIQIR